MAAAEIAPVTPLERAIRAEIAAVGPMRLDRYMALCLGHPAHGYYMKQDPLGEAGDFVTAPEVSQMFGELIGVWCVAAWIGMGRPEHVALVELGPGRGTLMRDALRAARRAAPGFAAAARVNLVETSPVLRDRQQAALGTGATWHDGLESVPEGPLILLANEFFDALPVRQFERREGRWHERVVGLAEDRLAIGLPAATLDLAGRDGDVVEVSPARQAIGEAIGRRLSLDAGVALIVDYGHLVPAQGDTLQAMRRHAHAGVLDSPGDCDLTAHVDFAALGRALAQGGAVAHPPMSQRDFLLHMGLAQRAQALAASADPPTRGLIERQMSRLADAKQMGNLFKVLAAGSPGLATPYPFGTHDPV